MYLIVKYKALKLPLRFERKMWWVVGFAVNRSFDGCCVQLTKQPLDVCFMLNLKCNTLH